MAKKKRPSEPRHITTSISLVAFRCVCGYPWQNEKLKGKTDDDLIVERDEAIAYHIREMEKAGY